MTDEITPTFNDVTSDQFHLYVEIQRSGQFNMMDMGAVEMESEYELDRDTQKLIHKHYDELMAKYGEA